jgi:hypothetical protein
VVSTLETPELVIGRVRVVDHAGDALRARLAADRLLSGARPAAPGLAPGAVLVVRRLADPMPGTHGDCAAPARWRTGVETALGELARSAARPARGPVPDSASAVLFEDRAELLACLLADCSAGVGARRWWWSTWLRSCRPHAAGDPVEERLPSLLEDSAADVPAALELLAARGLAVRAVLALAPTHALAIALAAAAAHGLRWSAPMQHVGGKAGSVTAPARLGDAPWLAIAPEARASSLDPARELLLGIALVLRRAPAIARTPGFRAAVAGWWAAWVPADRAKPESGSIWGRDSVEGATSRGRAEPQGRARRPRRAAPSGAPDRRRIRPPRARARSPRRPAPAAETSPGSRAVPVRRNAIAPSPAPSVAVATRLAGLFYLLNVAIYLGIYGDFTTPRRPGIALDPWDFVALVGRRLLADAHREDPVWRVLAELAPDDLPGAGFSAPRTWRVPPEWLEPFEAGHRRPWRCVTFAGRARVLHPSGFTVIDIPVQGDGASQVARELARYGAPLVAPARPERQGAPPVTRDDPPPPRRTGAGRRAGLHRWTGWIAEYVDARLRIALRARTGPAAVAVVLKRPGTIRASAGRVDVTFPLADLPVALRRAGIDRSPGWVPAAGRHLDFHFD